MKRSTQSAVGIALAALLIAGVAVAEPPAANNFVAHLTGDEEVFVGTPSPSDSNATGQAIFQLNPEGTSLSYRLIVANIENVNQAHIHLGPVGTNGPVVAFLFGLVPSGGGRVDGVLATGTITAADLVGPILGTGLVRPHRSHADIVSQYLGLRHVFRDPTTPEWRYSPRITHPAPHVN